MVERAPADQRRHQDADQRAARDGEVFDTEVNSIKEWYVVGVGVVRRETYVQPYGGWRDYHTTEILSSYDVN